MVGKSGQILAILPDPNGLPGRSGLSVRNFRQGRSSLVTELVDEVIWADPVARRPRSVRFLEIRIHPRQPGSPKQANEGALAMTQILEPSNCSMPARRRTLPAAPVLIRVPALSAPTVGGRRAPVRRRRLRREIRVAGYWLLALIPPSVACATWGGSHTPMLLAVNSPDRSVAAVASLTDDAQPRIMLSIEPVAAPQLREAAPCSVVLSGQLLPADAPEETAHGGY